jgi:hypothetical protein
MTGWKRDAEKLVIASDSRERGNLMGSEKRDCIACSEAVIEIASSYKTFLAMTAKRERKKRS